MAFKIQRHSLKDVATIANQAAQAKASLAESLRAKETAAQHQHDIISMQAASMSREQDFQNKLELMGISQEMNKQAAAQNHAWQLEKIQLQDQNDFERMMFQQNEISNRIFEQKLSRAQEMQTKLEALDKAYEEGRGIISERTYQNARIKLISGYAPRKVDPMEQLLGDMVPRQTSSLTPQAAQSIQQPQTEQAEQGVAMLEDLASRSAYAEGDPTKRRFQFWKKSPVANVPVMKAKLMLSLRDANLDPASKQQLQMIINSGNDDEIISAYQKLFEG